MAADCEFSSFSSQSEESSPNKVQSEESSSKEVRNWLELPSDVTCLILKKLGTVEILTSAQRVCKLWSTLLLANLYSSFQLTLVLDAKQCHFPSVSKHALIFKAVLTCYLDMQELTSNLKRLRLVSCCISDEGLSDAAKKLPLLEDLEISLCFLLFTRESLEVVGRCCPRLRTLKYNKRGYRQPCVECDEEALAIAESMLELHYLQLFGNKLTNDGLQAILDGCPHLEYLDLRQCFNITLPGDLGEGARSVLKPCGTLMTPLMTEFRAQNLYGSVDEDCPCVMSDIDFSSDGNYDYDYHYDYNYDYDYVYDYHYNYDYDYNSSDGGDLGATFSD
ncbi:Leucine-rich repeat [Dillenia turbinata]|uniref:Leucine-rich repeat n=1 Tax=Dillenia turbinata TaxID=194707 RepID=A0AAN8VLJ4_9MAGN